MLLPLAWRNLWRNRRRTVITLIVVSMSLWSILCYTSMLDAWAESSRTGTLRLLIGDGQIHAAKFLDDPSADHRMNAPRGGLLEVLNGSNVRAWAPRVRSPGVVFSEYRSLPISLYGVDPNAERGVSIIPERVDRGRYLDGPDDNGIVLGRSLAKRLRTEVGKRVVVMMQTADGSLAERGFRVIGVYRALSAVEQEAAFVGMAAMRSTLKLDDEISEISFFAVAPDRVQGILERLRAASPTLDVRSWEQLAPLTRAIDSLSREFILVWLWIMFFLMALGVVNTQLMAVLERTREFGLMKALGMRPRLVVCEVALEAAILTGLGVVVGFALSVLTIATMFDGLSLGFLAEGMEVYGAGGVLYPKVDVTRFAFLSMVVWGLGVVATLWPAWRASRSDPADAMARV